MNLSLLNMVLTFLMCVWLMPIVVVSLHNVVLLFRYNDLPVIVMDLTLHNEASKLHISVKSGVKH